MTPRRIRPISHVAPLSATLAALVGLLPLAAAEADPPAPAPAADETKQVDPAEAERRLAEYNRERDAKAADRRREAEDRFNRGMRALEQGRNAEAVLELELALQADPGNDRWARALADARAKAGMAKDPAETAAERVSDEMQVRQQELWNDAMLKKADGLAAMQTGDFNAADRSFQMALTRLEGLPFADDRRASAMREIEDLAKAARERRDSGEREEAARRNAQAADRERELRDLGLKLERDRIDALLRRALRARDRRDYDEGILLSEQVLKINRAEPRAVELLARCRRERHAYLRQMTADRWEEEHTLLSESIRSQMLPQLEIIRYSSLWPEIDARRNAPSHGLSADRSEESWRKDLNNQLEQQVTLDWQDEDLSEAVAYLQRITNVNLILDPRVVANQPPPVNLRVGPMKLKFVLEHMTRMAGLTYTLRDNAIYISSDEGVRGDLAMRIYDVRDLTHQLKNFPGPDLDIPEPGGTGTRLLAPIESGEASQTSEFIDIIQRVVSPNTWSPERGTSIEEFNGQMVVNQAPDVHNQIEELLRHLRNQRGIQIHVKVKFLEIENSFLQQLGVQWGVPNIQPGVTYGEAGRPNQLALDGTLVPDLPGYTPDSGLLPGSSDGLRAQVNVWQLASNFSASALLQAIERTRRGNVLFEPDLTLFNGQQSYLVHITQESYIADYDVSQDQYDPIINVLSSGTVLDVQAIASADKKYITLTLRPTSAKAGEFRDLSIESPPEGFSNTVLDTSKPLRMPQMIYSAVRTSVTIPDGGSLVIAGMTNGNVARASSGIPVLSSIPFLGQLFRTDGDYETELRQMIVVQADLVLFDEIESKL